MLYLPPSINANRDGELVTIIYNITTMATRGLRKAHTCLVLLPLFFLHLHCQISIAFTEAKSKVHIVYMGERRHEDPVFVVNSHHDMLTTLLGSKETVKDSILYSYKHGFSGFAARLTESQAELIAEFPGVVQVMPNRIHKLHTTRSWDFLGLASYSQKNLLTGSKLGEGTIIGVIDSGVWPESKSFDDKGMSPIPSRWKGICQHGELFNSTNCNKKLIGARWFVEGYKNTIKKPITTIGNADFLSPRDGIGHGTHTASTAAGCLVEKANYRGLGEGVARGGAPRARLAVYKACWAISDGCTDADLLKAFDEAIHDGVDVLSLSVGIDIPLFPYIDGRDAIAIGSFHAVAKGITVVASAGNSGPFSHTIVNTAPWIITVAATTIDRAFPTAIILGNNRTLLGQSMDTQNHKGGFLGLVYSEHIAIDVNDTIKDDGSKSCMLGSLNTTLAAGKVVLCFAVDDQQNIQAASISVLQAGGIGLIFAQPQDNLLESCNFVPCIKVNYEVGTQILSYIRKARSPVVKLHHPKTVVGKWVSPRVAHFSSRGPSSLSPAVLKAAYLAGRGEARPASFAICIDYPRSKFSVSVSSDTETYRLGHQPDIAAPGVNILAAYPQYRGPEDSDEFIFESGTSMACPHVAGIVALIKSLHPDWSPAAIKSALITTASQTGTDGDKITAEGETRKPADPFDIGGGHVDPNRAAYPGLIYDMSMGDYVDFLCDMGYNNSAISKLTIKPTSCPKTRHSVLILNLPSISIPYLKQTVTISRTVTNVGPINSEYKALVEPPNGVKMIVKPDVLSFNSTVAVLPFTVKFTSILKVHGDYSFGSLTWTNGEHLVRSPIAVRAIKFDSYADM